ncbi:MAG: hypothetical protein MZU79_01805 [Anaerotruncus sp.]|nr:hypothetical protein [Anaerotruncus sp.]
MDRRIARPADEPKMLIPLSSSSSETRRFRKARHNVPHRYRAGQWNQLSSPRNRPRQTIDPMPHADATRWSRERGPGQ